MTKQQCCTFCLLDGGESVCRAMVKHGVVRQRRVDMQSAASHIDSSSGRSLSGNA